MTTKIQSGAYRAAALLNSYPKVSYAGMSLANYERMIEEWAKIIERETAAPKMLEALERASFGMRNYVRGEIGFQEALEKVEAAIRKARNE